MTPSKRPRLGRLVVLADEADALEPFASDMGGDDVGSPWCSPTPALAKSVRPEVSPCAATGRLRAHLDYDLLADRPPLAAVLQASARFPTLQFMLLWDDPVRRQGGTAVFGHGEVLAVVQAEVAESFYRADPEERSPLFHGAGGSGGTHGPGPVSTLGLHKQRYPMSPVRVDRVGAWRRRRRP